MIALLACTHGSGSIEAALRPDPSARLQVWAFSLDGGRAPANVAHSFSSLDALVLDGELVVAGLASAGPPTWWEERFPRLFVDALTTRDLATWSSRRWYVDAPGRSLIDPALAMGPDGLELWFVQAEGRADPAARGRPTRIVRTRLRGSRFGGAETWHEGTGLVDPSPAWFGGAWRVFATRDQSDVVEVSASGVTPRVPGATVPHARVLDGALQVVAQRQVDGRRMPVVTRSADGTAWSAAEPIPLPGSGGLRSCASPVTAEPGGERLLLCVDER